MAPSQGLTVLQFLSGTLKAMGVTHLEGDEKDWLLARWEPGFDEFDCKAAAPC